MLTITYRVEFEKMYQASFDKLGVLHVEPKGTASPRSSATAASQRSRAKPKAPKAPKSRAKRRPKVRIRTR